MRTRGLLFGLMLFAMVGFRCPGEEPRLGEVEGGGAGGEPPGVSDGSGTTGGGSAIGGGGFGGAPPPPPTFCESQCSMCANEVLCQGLCEQREAECGLEAVDFCFTASPQCELIQVMECLDFERGCPLSTSLTCKLLCEAMLGNCGPQFGAPTSPDACASACEDDLANCIPELVPPTEVLDCARIHAVENGCEEPGMLNECVGDLCDGTMCATFWVDDGADNSDLQQCPVSTTLPQP